MRLLGLFLLLTAGPAFAGESVILANGARLHVDRHEVDGSKVRLFSGDGYLEMDGSRVQGFEADEIMPPVAPEVPPPPAAAPVAPPPTPQDLADAAADKYGLPRKLVR